MAAGEHSEFVNNQLTLANKLRDDKEKLFEQISANRELLRLTAKTGDLSKEQAAAIQEFYPPVTKGRGKAAAAPAK